MVNGGGGLSDDDDEEEQRDGDWERGLTWVKEYHRVSPNAFLRDLLSTTETSELGIQVPLTDPSFSPYASSDPSRP